MGQFVHDGILYEELPNGKARVVGPAQDGGQGGQVFSLPNPKAQFEAPQAAATLAKTQQDMAFARAEADRKAREWNATHFPDGTPKPEAAKPASADPDRLPQIRSALENIKRIRELSQKSLAVGGYSSSAGKVPFIGPWLGQNRANIEGALQMVQGDLIQQQIARLSQMNGGKGVASIANSETEAARMAASIANLDPNQNLDEFTRGLDRAEQFYRRQFANLNHANLNDPKERQRYGIAMDGSSPPSAPAIDGESGPRGPDMGLATGDQKFTPDEAGSRLATELARNGMSDEQINAAMTAAGFAPLQPASINSVREYLKQNPGFRGTVPGVGKFDETSLLNKAAASPVGTFIGNAGVAGSAGLPVLIGGQEAKTAFDAASEANPKSALAGGAVGGLTASIGGGKLLGLTKLAPFIARNPGTAALLGDTLYGGTYGFNTANEGEGVEGAAFGVGGALLGNRVGSGLTKVAGGTMRGVVNPSIDYLRSRGVPLTGGQMLGGFVKSVEDKATSIPVLGDLIRNRRTEGLKALNDAAFQEAGDAIGFPVKRTGSAGVEDLRRAAGTAYDSATAGVTVPLDPQFRTDYGRAANQGLTLPEDLSGRFQLAVQNRVDPVIEGGIMTGEGYQQAIRGLKGYKAETTRPGFEQDYRDALSATQDALTGAMTRGGGSDVVTGLRNADTTYRMAKVLEDAVKRARNGSRSGEAEIFTPSQLNDAAVSNKFSGNGTNRPFYKLATAGQEVLPSQVPDSGTAGRVLSYGLGAGLLGTGSATGNGDEAASAAGAIAALSLLNTKGGTKVMEKLLLRRPDIMRRFGQSLIGAAPRAGMFGRGAGATAAGMIGN